MTHSELHLHYYVLHHVLELTLCLSPRILYSVEISLKKLLSVANFNPPSFREYEKQSKKLAALHVSRQRASNELFSFASSMCQKSYHIHTNYM